MVFNASAAAQGRASLKDVLDPGPSLLPGLAGLLLRFRENTVTAQAEAMKILGAAWTPEDTLSFPAHRAPEDADNKCSKRYLLQKVASLYDPLGLVSPFVV